MEKLVHRLIEMRAIESRSAIMLSSPFKDSSRFGQKAQIHLGETYQQINNLETCLALLGLDHVPVTGIACEPGVDSISLYVWKHLEIAHYLALIPLAEEIRQDRVANLLRRNLAQDNAMANWLQMQIAHSSTVLPVMGPIPDHMPEHGQYQ